MLSFDSLAISKNEGDGQVGFITCAISILLLIQQSLPTSYVLVVNDLVPFAVLKVEFVSLKVTHANTVTVPSSVSAERD